MVNHVGSLNRAAMMRKQEELAIETLNRMGGWPWWTVCPKCEYLSIGHGPTTGCDGQVTLESLDANGAG